MLCFYANGPNGRAPSRDVAKSKLEISAITAFYTSNARSVLSGQFKLSRKHTKKNKIAISDPFPDEKFVFPSTNLGGGVHARETSAQ